MPSTSFMVLIFGLATLIAGCTSNIVRVREVDAAAGILLIEQQYPYRSAPTVWRIELPQWALDRQRDNLRSEDTSPVVITSGLKATRYQVVRSEPLLLGGQFDDPTALNGFVALFPNKVEIRLALRYNSERESLLPINGVHPWTPAP